MAPTVALAKGVSPFLFTAIEHGLAVIGFIVYWLLTKRDPRPHLRATPWWLFVAAFFGIPLNHLGWVFAVHNAPPLEATLIIYTWPLLVVIFTAISLKKPLRRHHVSGALLGFGGIITLFVARGLDFGSISLTSGHVWALVAALSWSIFAAIAARQSRISADYLAVVFFFSCMTNIFIWECTDAPSAPAQSLKIAAGMLLFISNGYALWDYASKKGNIRLIAIFSFMTPVLATIYLMILGEGTMTPGLVLSLLLVMSGIGLAKYGDRRKQYDA